MLYDKSAVGWAFTEAAGQGAADIRESPTPKRTKRTKMENGKFRLGGQ